MSMHGNAVILSGTGDEARGCGAADEKLDRALNGP